MFSGHESLFLYPPGVWPALDMVAYGVAGNELRAAVRAKQPEASLSTPRLLHDDGNLYLPIIMPCQRTTVVAIYGDSTAQVIETKSSKGPGWPANVHRVITSVLIHRGGKIELTIANEMAKLPRGGSHFLEPPVGWNSISWRPDPRPANNLLLREQAQIMYRIAGELSAKPSRQETKYDFLDDLHTF